MLKIIKKNFKMFKVYPIQQPYKEAPESFYEKINKMRAFPL